ncbi:MAG: transketolase C-terminal domain-containing protein [Myxococcota bacterium]
MTGRDLLRAALRDPNVTLVGEAVGVHGVTEGFPEGPQLIRTPLSESATIAVAAGLAMAGRRVVVELVDPAGLARAADALADVATLRARSNGSWTAPIVVRAPYAPVSVPGVKVAVAATAEDLVGLLAHALAGDEPVVLLEADCALEAQGSPAEVPGIGAAVVRRAGTGCTVLAVGDGVPAALAVEGVEVVDLRGLSPIDAATVGASVRKTGRAVAVGPEGPLLVALREAFLHLESPLVAVAPDAVADAVAQAIHY